MQVDPATMNVSEKGSSSSMTTWYNARGHGKTFIHGRGRSGGGRGRSNEYRNNVQCFNYKTFGHVKAKYWGKDKHSKKGVTLVVEERETNNISWQLASQVMNQLRSGWLIEGA